MKNYSNRSSKGSSLGKGIGITMIVIALLLGIVQYANANANEHSGYSFGVVSAQNVSASSQMSDTPVPVTKKNSKSEVKPTSSTASSRIVAGHSWDPNQYYTDQGLNYWSYRACSSFSFWSTFNAWGAKIPKAGDVIGAQIQLGSLGSDGIWVKESAYTDVATYYHFTSNYSTSRSLDQIIAIANSGYPVIIGISGNVYGKEYNKSYYQTENLNHIMVIKGGDAQNVSLVDSSKFNLQSMSRSTFTSVWGGMSFVVWPKNGPAPKL